MSSASRSRIAFWYSVRLSLRKVSVRPGFGAAEAARSREFSRAETTASYAASSGLGRPGGGIIRPRSFRTTFSQASACSLTRSMPAASRARPAVLTRSLWHATQYWLMVARCVATGSGALVDCGDTLPAPSEPADAHNTAKQPARHTGRPFVIDCLPVPIKNSKVVVSAGARKRFLGRIALQPRQTSGPEHRYQTPHGERQGSAGDGIDEVMIAADNRR